MYHDSMLPVFLRRRICQLRSPLTHRCSFPLVNGSPLVQTAAGQCRQWSSVMNTQMYAALKNRIIFNRGQILIYPST
uniref:Uncharacterized protein n=1 Tax=Anguilla anguilla TaxID=7936 RepID=A0A0E9X057_ANGAN